MLLYTEPDIVSDGFIQQVDVLRDIPDVMLPFPNIIENVTPIYTNFPPLWFKQPQDYIGQRGLSCTTSSHQGNGMIFRNSDINIFDSVVTISRIFERHVLQFKVIPDLQPFGISLFSGRGQGGAFLVFQFMQIRQNRIDGVRIVVERVHAFNQAEDRGFQSHHCGTKKGNDRYNGICTAALQNHGDGDKEYPAEGQQFYDVDRQGSENSVPEVVLQDFSRSEEHTSELQSRGHLVCRLLLEKKKK